MKLWLLQEQKLVDYRIIKCHAEFTFEDSCHLSSKSFIAHKELPKVLESETCAIFLFELIFRRILNSEISNSEISGRSVALLLEDLIAVVSGVVSGETIEAVHCSSLLQWKDEYVVVY